MKQYLICFILILFIQGCNSKVEIPVGHVGVIIKDERVDTTVLKQGEYIVSLDSKVIIFDANPANLSLDFDFLFGDASEGILKLTFEFEPIADSLSSFYNNYRSIYVTPIVDQQTRQVVRDLLFNYKPTDLTRKEFEQKISEAISMNSSITAYVHVSEVKIIELSY